MLIALLWIQMTVTFFGAALPTLFIPYRVLVQYRLPVAEPVLFLRLLGAASLGLATMFGFGIMRAYHGGDVTDVVVIGLATDGMAAAVIWRYTLSNALDSWPGVARRIILVAGGVLTALALGLLGAGFGFGYGG